MSLHTRLQTHKLFISDNIQELLTDFGKETSELPMADSAKATLAESLLGGKLIRGSLICLMYQMFSKQEQVSKEVYTIAAAEEILASALLIHDDVMDKDRVRRGKPSVFARYETEGKRQGIQSAEHYGYSQAILIGDICFFWVQKIISQLDLPSELRLELQNIFATETLRTGFGQMLDVQSTHFQSDLSQAEIESIALNKTARYTFVLPFLLGAALANVQDQTKRMLEELGNTMGTLFQIKDDELGLFGTEEQTGKPEGNDVREGKQTLYYFFAKQMLSGSDLETFAKLYGTSLNNEELIMIRDLVQSSGAFDKVQSILMSYAQTSNNVIEQLPIEESDKQEFKEFLTFNLQRKR